MVSELERLCDWLIVLTGGQVQLAGPTDDLLEVHRLLTVPRATADAELPGLVVHRTDSDRHSTVLVRTDPVQPTATDRPGWQTDPVSFEQLVMAYLQRSSNAVTRNTGAEDDTTRAAARPGPTTKAVSR